MGNFHDVDKWQVLILGLRSKLPSYHNMFTLKTAILRNLGV